MVHVNGHYVNPDNSHLALFGSTNTSRSYGISGATDNSLAANASRIKGGCWFKNKIRMTKRKSSKRKRTKRRKYKGGCPNCEGGYCLKCAKSKSGYCSDCENKNKKGGCPKCAGGYCSDCAKSNKKGKYCLKCAKSNKKGGCQNCATCATCAKFKGGSCQNCANIQRGGLHSVTHFNNGYSTGGDLTSSQLALANPVPYHPHSNFINPYYPNQQLSF